MNTIANVTFTILFGSLILFGLGKYIALDKQCSTILLIYMSIALSSFVAAIGYLLCDPLYDNRHR